MGKIYILSNTNSNTPSSEHFPTPLSKHNKLKSLAVTCEHNGHRFKNENVYFYFRSNGKKVRIPRLESIVVIGRPLFLPYHIVLSIWPEHIIESPASSSTREKFWRWPLGGANISGIRTSSGSEQFHRPPTPTTSQQDEGGNTRDKYTQMTIAKKSTLWYKIGIWDLPEKIYDILLQFMNMFHRVSQSYSSNT